VTYCDYGEDVLVCKPQPEMYQKAMSEAGITDKGKCLFVDDSYGISPLFFADIVNVVGAKEFGWKEVCHLLFPEDTVPPAEVGIRQIHDLEELREIFPHVFQK
jgi:pyrimidine and pyridine-specific 5'-nucleotidase